MKGWGGVLEAQGQSTGHWSVVEGQALHINVLELMAGFLTFQSFCREKTGIHTRLMMDSEVASERNLAMQHIQCYMAKAMIPVLKLT